MSLENDKKQCEELDYKKEIFLWFVGRVLYQAGKKNDAIQNCVNIMFRFG